MNLKDRALGAAKEVDNVLSPSLTEEEIRQIAEIVESAMTDAIHETSQKSSQVVRSCCSADLDMAHKISTELELAKKALLANLMSLR